MQHLRRITAALLLVMAFSGPALAQDICRTPDGFVLAQGKGIGGTGMPEGGNGIGGTGLKGDVGVYGRITGFASICVNGMEIEYAEDTPVTINGKTSTTRDLQVGQIVAVRATPAAKGFNASAIAIEKILSGPVSRIDRKRGTITVSRQTILAGAAHNALMETLRKGDTVAVSGLRRADGVIVAGHIEKTSQTETAAEAPRFGAGVESFAIQGYVKNADANALRLADGTLIKLPEPLSEKPDRNERVIVFGRVDSSGAYIAETLVAEHADFTAGVSATPPPGTEDPAAPADKETLLPGSEPLLPPETLPLELPSLELEVPELPLPVDVPEVPPVDLPPVDLPPVDLPVLPPVDVPVINPAPVEIPVLPGLLNGG